MELARALNRADLDLHATSLREDPLYLDRCQINTPDSLVELAWHQVRSRRDRVAKVVDFGAGDVRFSRFGEYASYVGYEIDARQFESVFIPAKVELVGHCAFSSDVSDADLCIGNPPYVRNQDLPVGWRAMAAAEVHRRTGVTLSGLANAWQYFLMLALSSVKDDGLVVQIVPYEWVSRPAAQPIRTWIEDNHWAVDVYRLPDGIFTNVLTAASISVIDKRRPGGGWRFHDMHLDGSAQALPSATHDPHGIIPYRSASQVGSRARRGLSPGTQKVLTLTESERAHAELRIGSDVVGCVTTLRHLPSSDHELSDEIFGRCYRDAGLKCWLIRTDREPSAELYRYLHSIDQADRQTATCAGRRDWWRFRMPVDRPQILVAQSFKGRSPKVVTNAVRAVPVGGVAGIYEVEPDAAADLSAYLRNLEVSNRLVPYAKQMHKLEVNQLNSLLESWSTLAVSSL